MAISSATLSLFTPSGSGTAVDLLGIATGTTSTAGNGMDPLVALKTAETGQAKAVAAIAKQPTTARDIAAFKAALATAKTPADLLGNPTALKVLLTANGLGDQAEFPALAKKALLSDTSKPGSLASKLTNTAWLAAARTFDFANKGLSVLKKAAVQQTVTGGYAEVQWRKGLDAATPGLSNALDFRARAASAKTADAILGDPTLRTVVTTTLGIPPQIAFQTLEAQEKAITDKLDIGKLQSPAFVEQFARRYLVAATTAATGGSSYLTALFA